MRIKPAAEPRLAAEGSAGLADAPMADEAASTGDSRLTYSVDEVAEMLGLSRSAVCERIARGEIPAKRVGRRLVVVRTVLEAFLPDPCSAATAGAPPSSFCVTDRPVGSWQAL